MVTTRRQSHGPPEGVNESSSVTTSDSNTKKRRNGKENALGTPTSSSLKRRRVETGDAAQDAAKDEGNQDTIHVYQKKLPVRRKLSAEREFSGLEEDHWKRRPLELSSTTADGEGSIEPAARQDVQVVIMKKSEFLTGTNQDNPQLGILSRQTRGESSSHTKAAGKRHVDNGNPATHTSSASHVRFGSEPADSTVLPMLNGHSGPAVGESPDSDEDEDSESEAPETVTMSSGQEKARALEAETAKAAEVQAAAGRKKRQERDARLRQQAEVSKKNKKQKRLQDSKGSPQIPNGDLSGDGEVILDKERKPQPRAKISTSDLPDLLPDDILAAEPMIRPPTPPLEPEDRNTISKKHRFFERDEKRPRDVKRGPVTVRVLEKSNTQLAPKVAKSSKSLKEAWLAGRRGKNGVDAVPRRRLHGGFLVKR
ncbi:MAG: hypothetical protein M1827_002621 [Pycnora praestabilis]|nr:MAG: hypothetical protein M1827_002621 [Pycnora praestabilis]